MMNQSLARVRVGAEMATGSGLEVDRAEPLPAEGRYSDELCVGLRRVLRQPCFRPRSDWVRLTRSQILSSIAKLVKVVFRRCPTLPHPGGCSTIGAGGLSFRVRDGSGRFPSAMAAVTCVELWPVGCPGRAPGAAQWMCCVCCG
jgi:hypothetical protein